MKLLAVYLTGLLFLIISACGDAEQQADSDKDRETEKAKKEEKVDLHFPRLSPRAEVMQTIGITEAVIDYSRPYVRDREIWGDLVPFDEVWRTGADAPTTLTIQHDATVNGKPLRAGKYILRSIPQEDDVWTFLFISETDDDSKDEIRIETEATSTDKHYEMMTFSFEEVSENAARIVLAWENLKTGFEIEVETDELVADLIDRAIEQAGDDEWEVYSQSARYLIEQGNDLDQAEEWINKALDIEENWRNYFTLSLLHEARGDIKAATEHLETAIEIGREQEGDDFGAESFLSRNLERLQEER